MHCQKGIKKERDIRKWNVESVNNVRLPKTIGDIAKLEVLVRLALADLRTHMSHSCVLGTLFVTHEIV